MRSLMVVVVLAAMEGVAQAQGEAPAVMAPISADPTAHRHLGFFLRVDLAPDYLHTSASQGGSSVALSGVGASVGVVLGAAISEDWIIGGDVWGVSAFSPSASNGASLGDQTLSLSGIGLNVTHYFMPENVYVSFSPSLVSLSLGNDQGSGSTNIGFGARLLVGKEWWVGNHWGLGLAGEAIFGVNSDQGGGPTWVTFGGAVLFTATYN